MLIPEVTDDMKKRIADHVGNPILADLAQHFEKKVQTAIHDFISTCTIADIPPRQITLMLTSLMASKAAFLLAEMTTMAPEQLGELMRENVTKLRNLKRDEPPKAT